MPGFNQQGPCNQGPMSGKRRGICSTGTGPNTNPKDFQEPSPAGFGNRCSTRRRAGRRACNRSFRKA